MAMILFNHFSEKEKSEAVEKLITGSTPSPDFFLMVILSVLMATIGLLLDNSAIVIGSMLIAPILYPILSLSLGIIMSDGKLISRSFLTVLKSAFLGIFAAMGSTLLFSFHNQGMTSEIISRTEPSLLYAIVAMIAGLAATFALVKPKLSETLPGIAISVALIPPLAVVGIGLANLSWYTMSTALVLFLVNAFGIIFASMITFSLMNFYVKKRVAEKTIVKEDEKLEKEKEKIEREKEKEEKEYGKQ